MILREKWFCKRSGPYVVILYEKVPYGQWFGKKTIVCEKWLYKKSDNVMKILLFERWLCKKSDFVKSGFVREVFPYEVILYENVPYENWFCKESNYVLKVVMQEKW
jgi:hypothetical protein